MTWSPSWLQFQNILLQQQVEDDCLSVISRIKVLFYGPYCVISSTKMNQTNEHPTQGKEEPILRPKRAVLTTEPNLKELQNKTRDAL